jgi:ABC transporter transmembrane region
MVDTTEAVNDGTNHVDNTELIDIPESFVDSNEEDEELKSTSKNGGISNNSTTAIPSDEEISNDDIHVNKTFVNGTGKDTTSNDSASTSDTASTSTTWFCLGYFSKQNTKRPKCGQDLGVHEICLEDRANCLSRWLLSFMNPLLQLGSAKVLDEHDIGVPPKQDVAATAYTNSLKVWTTMANKCHATNAKLRQEYEAKLAKCQTEAQRKKVKEPRYAEPSIALALVKAFGKMELILGLIYYVMSALLTFVPVIILNDLLKFFQSGLSIADYNGLAHPWVEVAGLGFIPFLVSLLQTRHQTIYAHCAVFVRTAVSTMLYRKALRVSAAGRAKTSTGQVVNMMSNDTAQLQRFLQFVGLTIVAPVQIVLALVLIYFQVSSLYFL